MKRWFLYSKKADFRTIAERFGIDPVLARILRNRELNSMEEIEKYLKGGPEDLYSPLLLPDAIRCMNLLDRALREERRIRIVGDYDVDGVCASYILYKGLLSLGARVDYVIPHRIRDGYGINAQIIEHAKQEGVELLLTCDNGISAVEELSYAEKLGLTVLVTDHHDIRKEKTESGKEKEILPPAAAIMNPKRESSRYPFPEICGAVVAWKLLQLLYQKRNLPEEEAFRFVEFAAIATVCDVMSLRDENRIIVRCGLRRIPETENIGLRALLEVSGLAEAEKISAYHAGFIIGPSINAGGRLESAELALKLFLSEDREEAYRYAVRLKELNDARKDMTKKACEQAYALVEEGYREDRVLLLYLPELHESLAGIVAGRVRERFYRPTLIVTEAEPDEEGNAMAKGSARSIEGYSMAEQLSLQAKYLTKFGGHPMAAGFSLRRENIDRLREALNKDCRLSEEELCEKLWIDAAMPVDYVTEELVRQLSLLEPFGKGNEKPAFAQKGLRIRSALMLGKNRNAVRLELSPDGGAARTAVLFMDGESFMREKGEKTQIDIVYYPVINEYNGRKSLQLVIQDYQLKP